MSRLRTGARDAGTTMTELLVTMVILSVVVIATTTLTIGFERTNAENVMRQDQIDAGRVAVERMTRTLRVAVRQSQMAASCVGCNKEALVQAQPFKVVFHANIDNDTGPEVPRQVTYTVETVGGVQGVLLERLQLPDVMARGPNGWDYCDATLPTATAACLSRVTTRRLATGVRTDGTALFTYYDENSVSLAAGGAGLSAADLPRTASIELTVRVGSPGGTRPQATTYVQRVLLTNQQAFLRPDPGATP